MRRRGAVSTECAATLGALCFNDICEVSACCGVGMLCPQSMSVGPRLPESMVWHVLKKEKYVAAAEDDDGL